MDASDVAAALSELVSTRPVDEVPVAILLPDSDADLPLSGEHLGYAEGQSFLIEYRDSRGQGSRRRISVYDLREGATGVPILLARCHERKATRMFRVDRIVCCIDYDGEVHDDVAMFLHDTFGMTLQAARSRPSPSLQRWETVRSAISADAVLLAALSRADFHIHRSETDAAADHLCALVERTTNIVLTDDEAVKIWRYVGRLRPGEDAIRRALQQLGAKEPDAIKRSLLAAVRVVDADGFRHPQEMSLINEVALELVGVRLF